MMDTWSLKQGGRNVIAQSDDEDYSECGWVCYEHDGTMHLANYSHCSCYGTWTVIDDGGGPSWSGTREELIALVRGNRDPDMPERRSTPGDSDYKHLQAVYAELRKHFAIEGEAP